MISVRQISSPDSPPLVVRKRGDVTEILAGNVVLLSTAALETELAFGRMAAQMGAKRPERVLVGGLGFGATLRGVLDVASPQATIVVAEKVPGVVRLVREEFAEVASGALGDGRVSLVAGDVGEVIAGHAGDLDAILLDVDNGPDWASFRSNARLYSPAGLAMAFRALAPGGALAVWSGYPAPCFAARLRAVGFAPSVAALRERGRVRARAYVGQKPGPDSS